MTPHDDVSEAKGLIEILRQCSAAEQTARGYLHTLQEIAQQPETWRATARQVVASRHLFESALRGARAISLTGSGSSEYAGGCVHLGIRQSLQLPVEAVPAGLILTHGSTAIPALRPGLLVSLARSGDSPESCAVVEHFLRTEPEMRHLVITCNPEGRLARQCADDGRVSVFQLDRRTNDRSLAMTSSFTNLALAAGFLAVFDAPERYIEIADTLADIAHRVLTESVGPLAVFAATRFTKAVYLGSGPGYSAAREGALKMLEMTAGRVTTMSETPLGLRHGPMSWVDRDTVVVCFLSCNPVVRAYECDLIAELDCKGIGQRRIVIGEGIPDEIRAPGGIGIGCPGLSRAGDNFGQIAHVVAAQLLAFFRCLEDGLKPDAPSETGVISRVVGSFRIHGLPSSGGLK
jgi:tagatose-6-phosphate ketose/aldose isomerase